MLGGLDSPTSGTIFVNGRDISTLTNNALATLKVLGFRDRRIGRLLISQNIWLTILGVIIGLPAGIGVLQALLITLADEYELKLCLGALIYFVSN